MIEQEYFTSKQVSNQTDISERSVTKKARELAETKPESMIYKDGLNGWRIHHLLLPSFKRKRKRKVGRKPRYHSLTIDPNTPISAKDIHELLEYAVRGMGYKDVEFNYTIEQGLINKHNHIHAYYKTEDQEQFMLLLKNSFSEMNYYKQEIHDLDGWITYITKTDFPITTIKNNKL